LKDLKKITRNEDVEIPESEVHLRELLVDKVLIDIERYGIKNDKENRKLIKAMKMKGNLPREELLLAAADIFNIEVHVHHGMRWPVIYKSNEIDTVIGIIHLQCISGVHYNPVLYRMLIKTDQSEHNKLVNTCHTIDISRDGISAENNKEVIICECNGNNVTTETDSETLCNHGVFEGTTCFLVFGDVKICALIDTGSQICLIKDSVIEQLKQRGIEIECRDSSENTDTVVAIDGSKTEVTKSAELHSSILGIKMKSVAFAVVEENVMPCCCLIGANFLVENELVVDYFNKCLLFSNGHSNYSYPLKCTRNKKETLCVYLVGMSAILRDNCISDSDSADDTVELSSDDELVSENTKVKFTLGSENMGVIQMKDFAIRKLNTLLEQGTKVKKWNRPCLNQYKRHAKGLSVINGVVCKTVKQFEVPLIPFHLMVDVIVKVHNRLSHVGINKITNIVQQHFWHPAMNDIIREVCVSCRHCQLFKTSQSAISPPILKIRAHYPFDLVALDLLQFPKTSRDNIGLLVAVDHCSKFLMAAPIKDKSSHTVSSTFNA